MITCLNRHGYSVYLYIHHAFIESANYRMPIIKKLNMVSSALLDVPYITYY